MMSRINRLPRNRRVAVSAALTVAAFAGGTAYAATSPVTVTRTDTVVKSSSSTTLSATGGVKTPVLTLSFPKTTSSTTYVLSAAGDLVNFGPSDYTRCDLSLNGTEFAAVSTIVGDPSSTGSNGAAPYVSPLALTGAVTLPASGGTIAMACWHDESNGSTPYVDPGATVWAHKSTSLKLGSE